MGPFLNRQLPIIAFIISLMLMLAGCTTTRTAVSFDTDFQPDEGLVTLRLVDVNNVAFRRFDVVSEQTGEEFHLRVEQFGQTSSMTFVGRLPAGRYRPKQLWASVWEGALIVQRTLPLNGVMGKFDVEAQRVTDLGTSIFVEIGRKRLEPSGNTMRESIEFLMPLDPTPVPIKELLAVRFPKLAKANLGKSALGWVAGTVPRQPAGLIDQARLRVKAVAQPAFVDDNTMLAGGPLGVVTKYVPGRVARFSNADTVHAIETFLALKSGHWLIGGEEGFMALSRDQGLSWERIPGLTPEEAVIHLSQAADGRMLMVTSMDQTAVVYESAPDPIAWRVIRRLPSEGILSSVWDQAAHYSRDSVAVSRDHLMVFTRPETLNSLDLRTGQWETHETPRNFNRGIKATPDGYVVGMYSMAWIYGSLDYGKTWKRLEAWANMSQPHFMNRNQGVMIAADGLTLSRLNFKLRTTENGGQTWATGSEVGSGWWDQPLWSNPSGSLLFTTTSQRRLMYSRDQGSTWRNF